MNRFWLTLGALLSAVYAAAAPVLDVPLVGTLEATVGPAAKAGTVTVEFATEGGTAFLRNTGPERGKPQAVVATWPADVLPTAQGTILFKVRVRTHADPKNEKEPWGVLELAEAGGGGEWQLAIRETPFDPAARRKAGGKQAEGAPADLAVGLGEVNGAADDKGDELQSMIDEGDRPAVTLTCSVQLRPLPVKGTESHVTAALDTKTANGWHTVLWTWRSVVHEIYLDGKRCGAAGGAQTLSRLAPVRGTSAQLRLLGTDVDVRDLQVLSRYTDPEAVTYAVEGQAAPGGNSRVWADWAYATGRAVVYVDAAGLKDATAARVACVNEETGKTVAEVRLNGFPNGLGEAAFPVFDPAPFPSGKYHMVATVLDAAGNSLATATSAPWSATDWEGRRAKEWPWLGFTGGTREAAKTKVIPPYTAITAANGKLATVLLKHELDRSGLFKSVSAAGGELLAAPMRVEVTAGGKLLDFSRSSGLGPVQNDGAAASWAADSATAAGDRLTVNGKLEYDGVTLFDVTLTPQAALALDRVELLVPLRPEIPRLAHFGHSWWFTAIEHKGDGTWGCKRINWSGPSDKSPRRPGVLLSSADLYRGGLFPPASESEFAPYVHIGNFQRGLSWFADNDRNWIHALPDIPAMEFVAIGDQAFLRFNLVAKATTLRQPLTWRFGLLGNPFKPLPKDWRSWVIADNTQSNDISKRSAHRFWFHWSEYAEGFRPYPGGGKLNGTYEGWKDRFKEDALIHAPFINYGTPGGFAFWDEQFFVTPYTWKLHNSRPHLDYMTYWFDKCHRDIGVRGVYIDEPYCEPWTYNVLAGDAAYIRADGTRSIGWRYLEGREYMRRFKQLFTDFGQDYAVWVHSTNYRALPVFTFADISMDGEHPSIWVPEFDNYHAFYNPDMSRGYINGEAYGFVGTQMFHGNTNPKSGADLFQKVHFKSRSYLAVTLPYGVLPMKGGMEPELDRVQNLRAAFGIFDDGIESLTMNDLATWLPGAAFSGKGPQGISGERNRAGKRALLYVSGGAVTEPTRHELDGGLGSLALPDAGTTFKHLWDAETGVSGIVDGKTALDVAPLDFGVFWVEGRATAQASRPDGAILGVSFNAGLAPEYGGGLRPASLQGEGTDLLVPGGKEGTALRAAFSSKAVAYPLVPSWLAGTLQVDYQVGERSDKPLRLLQLLHHLNLMLDLRPAADGAPALRLAAREQLVAAKPSLQKATVGEEGDLIEKTMPLPPEARTGWHRLLLAWSSGRYTVYVDGKPVGTLGLPAGPRLRDIVPLADGLVLGDGSGKGSPKAEVLLDSLVLYDWCFSDAAAAQAGTAGTFAHQAKPAPGKRFTIWHKALPKNEIAVAANVRDSVDWQKVETIRFVLLRPGDKTELTTLALRSWYGAAWGRLSLDARPPSGKAAVGDDGTEADPDQALGEDKGGDYILRVELQRTEDKKTVVLNSRDVTFQVDTLNLDAGE